MLSKHRQPEICLAAPDMMLTFGLGLLIGVMHIIRGQFSCWCLPKVLLT
jgi:hypothetical protein